MTYTSANEQHVTAVISHTVKPGLVSAYEDWMHRIIPVAKGFPGYLGVNILRPDAGTPSDYVIVLHFDKCDHLLKWLNSPERSDLISQARPLIQDKESVQVLTGLETWFVLPKRPMRSPPPRYKMALLTWMGVFTTLTVVGRLIQMVLAPFPPLLTQFITVGAVVFILTYLIMPYLTRLFYRWLYPKQS